MNAFLPACLNCLGWSDSAQAMGMNIAIIFLLGVVFMLLGGLVITGALIAWREEKAAQRHAPADAGLPTESTR